MNILIVSGASGGHIFPALAYMDYLKNKNPDVKVKLVLPNSSIKSHVDFNNYKPEFISTTAIGIKPSFKNFLAVLKFFQGLWESFILFIKFKPDIVIGFGSLVCIPLVFWGWFFRKKTILHEQNVIPGQANKFLAKICDKIAVSFDETRGYFKGMDYKIITTGNLLRNSLNIVDKDKALGHFQLNKNKTTVLVMGGSQGSHSINSVFVDTLSSLEVKDSIQVIHLSGNADYNALEEKYSKSGLQYRLYGFLKEMDLAYSCADLVVSRAGATSIQEIILFKIPAILIPYPFAYQHQEANARVLEKSAGALIIKEADFKKDIFGRIFCSLIRDHERLQAMKNSYNIFKPRNSLEEFSKAVFSIL